MTTKRLIIMMIILFTVICVFKITALATAPWVSYPDGCSQKQGFGIYRHIDNTNASALRCYDTHQKK